MEHRSELGQVVGSAGYWDTTRFERAFGGRHPDEFTLACVGELRCIDTRGCTLLLRRIKPVADHSRRGIATLKLTEQRRDPVPGIPPLFGVGAKLHVLGRRDELSEEVRIAQVDRLHER